MIEGTVIRGALFLTDGSNRQMSVLFKKESNVLEKRILFLPKAASFMEMLS